MRSLFTLLLTFFVSKAAFGQAPETKTPVYMNQEAIETRLLSIIYDDRYMNTGIDFYWPHTRYPDEIFSQELIKVSAGCDKQMPESTKQELINGFESKNARIIDQTLRLHSDYEGVKISWERYYQITSPNTDTNFNVGVAIDSPAIDTIRILRGLGDGTDFIYAIPTNKKNAFLNLENWKPYKATFVCNPTEKNVRDLVNMWSRNR